MAIGSGLSGSLGWAPETTYGTYVAPTKWAEFNSESLKLNKKTIANEGLRGGARSPRINRRVLTTKDATGTLDLDVSSRNFGAVFSQLLGTTTPTATQVGTSSVYRQIHTIGNGYETRSMTVQVGRPQSDGVVKPFTYVGCKFSNFELACNVDEYLNLKAEIDARNELISQPLVAPVYPVGAEEMFHFGQISVETGGTVTTATGLATATGGTGLLGCKGFSLKHEVPMATDRYFAGATQLKAVPIENGMREITGKLSTEFASQAQLYDVMANETTTAIRIRFDGIIPVGTGVAALEILLPAVRFDSGNPSVDGTDILECEVEFTAYDDGINPVIQIVYESADATVA